MNFHLAAMECTFCHKAILTATTEKFKAHVLESYWTFKYKDDKFYDELHKRYERMKASGRVKTIIVDSGAHSIIAAYAGFKNTKHLLKQIRNINEYSEDYLRFVDRFKDVVDYFFEIDSAPFTYTYEVQRDWRDKFYAKVNNPHQFMPVWHVRYNPQNLRETLEQHFRDYAYIGISTELEWNADRFARYFEVKKDFNCNVHGLAITALDRMKEFPFFSVDSTSYLHDAITKCIRIFDKKTCTQDLVYLGTQKPSVGMTPLVHMNKAHHKPVFEYAAYLREKYGLLIMDDLFLLGQSSAAGMPLEQYHKCREALVLYNMATFLEMEEYLNTHGHDFTDKKQTELFDWLTGEPHGKTV